MSTRRRQTNSCNNLSHRVRHPHLEQPQEAQGTVQPACVYRWLHCLVWRVPSAPFLQKPITWRCLGAALLFPAVSQWVCCAPPTPNAFVLLFFASPRPGSHPNAVPTPNCERARRKTVGGTGAGPGGAQKPPQTRSQGPGFRVADNYSHFPPVLGAPSLGSSRTLPPSSVLLQTWPRPIPPQAPAPGQHSLLPALG
jgi:hypothetical protein